MSTFSSTTGALILEVIGTVSNGMVGSAVDGGRDADGDGIADLVVGAPGNIFGTNGHVALASVVGVGPGLVRYGTACPGAGGFTPSIAGFGGPPALSNSTFGISVARGVGGATAMLFAASSPAPQGFPIGGGCSAWLSSPFGQVAAIVLSGPPGVAGAGHGRFAAPVPADPTLQGATFYLEWALFDSAGPTGFVSVSDALVVTVF